MTQSPSASKEPKARPPRRFSGLFAALVIGLPLAWGLITAAPLVYPPAGRYLEHGVEKVEVAMFCVALGTLLTKLFAQITERAALRRGLLPAWDGKPVPVANASVLLASLETQPARFRRTYLGKRITAVLDFLRSRGSAEELDDYMRSLVDNDSLSLDTSYALTRFITWAVPILGFLGTVLGITGAISGISPEKLEKDLSAVTDGLAFAFDATALALGLTMIVMFISFLVERLEQGTLEAVDQYADRHLAHRFERTGAEGGAFVEVVRRNTEILLEATQKLVANQAAVWAKTLEDADKRRAEAESGLQDRLRTALEQALEHTQEAHAQRLAGLDKQAATQSAVLVEKVAGLAVAVRDTHKEQHAVLSKIAAGLAAQAEALAQLQQGEKQLVGLQEAMQHNLDALAGAGAFEKAVHSLTAAIHLMTMHSVPAGPRRPGMAA